MLRNNWKHDWTAIIRNAIDCVGNCKNFSELARILGVERRNLQYHCAKLVNVHDGERVFDAFKRAIDNGEITDAAVVPEKVPMCGTGFCHWCGEKLEGMSRLYCGRGCSQKFLNLHRKDRPRWIAWNEHFFDRLTPDCAYILGFIVADGHIRDSIHAERGTRAYVITISQKDSRILQLIARSLDFEGVLEDGGNSSCTQLCLGSKHAWKTLTEVYKIPVGKEKSYQAAIPEIILVNEECLPHFIRGLFDGDGYVDKKYSHFGLSSGSEKLVEDFNSVLSEKASLPCREKKWVMGGYDKVDGTRSGCWYIRWVSEKDCKKFARYIYGNELDGYEGDLYLGRKKERFARFFVSEQIGKYNLAQERAKYWNLGLGI